MKKCNNCIHLTVFNECSQNVTYEIMPDKFIGNKKVRIGNFIPIFAMRSEQGLCGPEANLYESKYVRVFTLISIFSISIIAALYMLKHMVLFLHKL